MVKKIVITSGGYIASLIVKHLLETGSYQVVVIVRDEKNKEKYDYLNRLNGAKEFLSFAFGDIENADYLSIFKDAYGIIHTASPVIFTSEDPQKNIIQPAIRGNLRVLEAASKTSSIQKVIILSSTAAIVDPIKYKSVYTEDDWNDSTSEKTPYPYSKYLAEKAAWDFSEKNGKQHYQLVFINPAFVFGPAVDATNLSISVELLLKLFKEDLNVNSDPLFQRAVGFVDVRDVSKAIIKVLQSYQNFDHQRYAMATTVINFHDLTKIIDDLYGKTYKVNIINLEKTPTPYSIESKSSIKLDSLIDIKTSIKDTVDWLLENNKLKPTLLV